MIDKTPRVILRIEGDNRDLAVVRGILIHENGLPFAVAEENALGSLPSHVRVPLDASQLEELPNDELEFPLFRYRKTVVLPR